MTPPPIRVLLFGLEFPPSAAGTAVCGRGLARRLESLPQRRCYRRSAGVAAASSEMRAVDATLLQRHGTWWMFANRGALGVSRYEEEPHSRLDPGTLAGSNRTHTFNSDAWLTVVDGHRDCPPLP